MLDHEEEGTRIHQNTGISSSSDSIYHRKLENSHNTVLHLFSFPNIQVLANPQHLQTRPNDISDQEYAME